MKISCQTRTSICGHRILRTTSPAASGSTGVQRACGGANWSSSESARTPRLRFDPSSPLDPFYRRRRSFLTWQVLGRAVLSFHTWQVLGRAVLDPLRALAIQLDPHRCLSKVAHGRAWARDQLRLDDRLPPSRGRHRACARRRPLVGNDRHGTRPESQTGNPSDLTTHQS